MRGRKSLLVYLLFSIINIHAQEGWFWQDPLPQGQNLNSVSFIDENTGWIVGGDAVYQSSSGSEGFSLAKTTATVMKTTDGGRNWMLIRNHINTGLNSVFFITNETGFAAGGGSKIFKTTDSGNKWIECDTPDNTGIGSISGIYFLSVTTGYAAGEHGLLLKTTNSGESWEIEEYVPGKNIVSFRAIYFSSSASGWIVGDGGASLKTSDGGIIWNWNSTELLNNPTSVLFLNDSTGWVAGRTGNNGLLLKTSDYGNTWVEQASDMDVVFNDIKFSSEEDGILLGSSGQIYITSDGGNSWDQYGETPYEFDRIKYDFNSVCYRNDSSAVIAGATGRIISTEDKGQSWKVYSSGDISNYSSSFFISDSIGWISGCLGVIMKTTNGGTTWLKMGDPFNGNAPNDFTFALYNLTTICFVSQTTGWTGGPMGVFKTIDSGSTWHQQTDESAEDLFFRNDRMGWGVSGIGKIIKTDNGGETWKQVSSGVTDHLQSVYFIDDYTGWTAGWNAVILKTTDSGETWSKKRREAGMLHSISFISPQIGWAAGGNGVILKSTDGGETWEYQTSNTRKWLYDIRFTSELNGWAAGMQGLVLRTTDGGENWNETVTPVYGSIFHQINSLSFVSETIGYAVGERGLILKTFDGGRIIQPDTVTGIPGVKNILSEFCLKQNYPNPFNPVTNIEYIIPEVKGSIINMQAVSLVVYDILGREIEVLVNGYKRSGSHMAVFDGSELASGIYLCRLSCGKMVNTKKLMLLK